MKHQFFNIYSKRKLTCQSYAQLVYIDKMYIHVYINITFDLFFASKNYMLRDLVSII